MAITRRQFVTRLGALAAAAGFSQAQASQIMDALAYPVSEAPYHGTFGKPRVVWLHGAECTGCSTSLLGIFENTAGEAIYGTGISTASALTLAGTLPLYSEGTADPDKFFLHQAAGAYHPLGLSPDPATSMDIADVVIDVLDIIYHETIMGMGGDLANQWLTTFSTTNTQPFVLVVEGALQSKENGGAWDDSSTASKDVPWCSIGMNGTTNGSAAEIDMPTMTKTLAMLPLCVAAIGIGQCATFGGYPGCKPPILTSDAHFDTAHSQTDAQGLHAFLAEHANANTADKVVNVPGCPTNPWWFVLSVAVILVDLPGLIGAATGKVGTLGVLKKIGTNANNGLGIMPNAGTAYVDGDRRITYVYGTAGVHGMYCPNYGSYVKGIYASAPGQSGCLLKIGCKGFNAFSLCGVHGWNGQQPQNPATYDSAVSNANLSPNGSKTGGHCTRAGHPCMACTEPGYPDSFVPFVVR